MGKSKSKKAQKFSTQKFSHIASYSMCVAITNMIHYGYYLCVYLAYSFHTYTKLIHHVVHISLHVTIQLYHELT